MKRILALDLSLRHTGYALPGGTVGLLEPPDAVGKGPGRLDWILSRILELIRDHDIDCVVLEGYSFGSQTSQVRASAELGGLIRWALTKKRIPYAEVPPSSLKQYATGNGGAGKPLMLAEAIRRLDAGTVDDNEIDALWLLHMAHDAYGHPQIQMPARNRDALGAVHWPGLPPPPPKRKRKRKKQET